MFSIAWLIKFGSSLLILNNNLLFRSPLCHWTIRPIIWRNMRSTANASSGRWILHPHISLMNWMFLNILILWHIMVILLIIHKSSWNISFINFIFYFFIASLVFIEEGRVLMLMLLWLNVSFVLFERLQFTGSGLLLTWALRMVGMVSSMVLDTLILLLVDWWGLHHILRGCHIHRIFLII